LTAFAARYPKVRVITRIGTIEEMVKQVRAQVATIVLFLSFKPISGIRCEVLDHQGLELVAAPQHPLAEQSNLSSDELGRWPFVTGLRNSRFYKMTDAALKSIGIAAYEIAMEVEESTATKEMVRRGRALACLPHCSVAAELKDGSLTSLNLAARLPRLNVYCGYTAQLGDCARNFMKYLRSGTPVR
jgi:DNA-binding transcriptional LysR family regulator